MSKTFRLEGYAGIPFSTIRPNVEKLFLAACKLRLFES
jgi:hypothetical protein